MLHRTSLAFALLGLLAAFGLYASPQETVKDSRSAGRVLDREGVATRRAALARRPDRVEIGARLSLGDLLEVGSRGANALRVRLAAGTELTLGPGALVELVDARKIALLRGELEVDPAGGVDGLTVQGPGGSSREIAARGAREVFRASEEHGEHGLSELKDAPGWLVGYRADGSTEALGSLLAQVDGRDVPLTMGYHKVTVDIRDQIARTVIEESFLNHTGIVLEGVFYFPLPADASISGFGMWIDGELVQGDIVEKQRAREIYETILRERRDPGLLEWAGGNLFKARVYPISGEKRIRIAYTQVLRREGDQFRYHYALRSEMLREHPLRRLEVEIRLSSTESIESVACPSHSCRIATTEHAADVSFSAEEYTPERDLEVQVNLRPRARAVSMIPHRRGDDGYFMVWIDGPPVALEDGRDNSPIDLLLLVDTSGSSWGEDRRRQIAAVEALISGLGDEDTFNLGTCDVDTRWLFDTPVPPGRGARERALQFLEDRDPLGWSDLLSGFTSAFARASRDTHIVYLGDGVPTTGAADPIELKHALARAYTDHGVVHAIVPGSSAEMQLLRSLAALGVGGSVRTIGGGSDAAQTAFSLLDELRSPVMKNVAVTFEGLRVAAVYPEVLPNLPAGAQHVMVGRFDPSGGEQRGQIRCSGTIDGVRQDFLAEVVLGSDPDPKDVGAGEEDQLGNSFIPRLWARHHLDHLLDQGSSASVRERIVTLSEDYQIITPYTSFLVLESDADRKRFGVRRRFRMRDGEAFFSAGRVTATHELTQAAMQTSQSWRRGVREALLTRLEDMGSELVGLLGQQPFDGPYRTLSAATGWTGGETLHFLPFGGDGGRRAGSWGSPRDGQKLGRADTIESEEIDELEALPSEPAADELFEKSDSRQKKVRSEFGGGSSSRFAPGSAGSGAAGFLGASFAKRGAFSYDPYAGRSVAGGSYYYGDPFASLIPVLGEPRAAASEYPWPKEVTQALQGLDRRSAIKALGSGFRIVASTRSADARGREMTSVHDLLVGPRSWVDIGAHVPGQTYPVGWFKSGERGVLQEGWRFGRTRASKQGDADAWSAPFAWYFGDDLRRVSGYEATLIKQDDGQTLRILFTSPEGGASLTLEVDPQRDVVLALEWRGVDGQISRQTFEAFAHLGGLWWPTRIHSFGADGEAGSVVTVEVRAMEDAAFDAEVDAELARLESATIFSEDETDLQAAKQAVKDGTAGVAERWLLASYFLGSQRVEDAEPHLSALVDALSGRPSQEIVQIVAHAQSRQNEELRVRLDEVARELVSGEGGRFPVDTTYGLALDVLRYTQSLAGGSERATLLRILEPIFTRQAGRIDAELPWDRAMVLAIAERNRPAELLVERRRVAEKWRYETSEQTSYAAMLAGERRIDDALAWLDRAEERGAPWPAHEQTRLQNARVQILWDGYRLEELQGNVEAWDRQHPTRVDSALFDYYLSALTYLGRDAELSRRVEEWLALANKEPREPHEQARLHAAIQHAIGQGHQLYHYRISDERASQLRSAAQQLAGREGDRWIAGWILQSGGFRATDDARALQAELYQEFTASLDQMPPWQIQAWIGWLLSWKEPLELADDAFEAHVQRIYERWSRSDNEEDRSVLAAVVHSHGGTTLRRRLLQRQLDEARRKEDRVALADQLFAEIVSGSWDASEEARAAELLTDSMGVVAGEGWSEAQLGPMNVRRAIAIHDLGRWMVDGRVARSLNELPDQRSMSRRQLQAATEHAGVSARRSAVLQLGELERTLANPALANPALIGFAAMERLYFTVRAGDETGDTFDEALEMLIARVDRAVAAADSAKEDGARLSPIDEVVALRAFSTCVLLSLRVDGVEGERRLAVLRDQADRLVRLDLPSLDGRGLTRDLLLAWDRVDALEALLATWFGAGDEISKLRFGREYAHLLAERGRLIDATAVLEEIDRVDELTGADYDALWTWYTALDKPADAVSARLRSYDRLSEYELSQGLYQALSRDQSSWATQPAELDPETPVRLRALMKKATHPQNYLWILQGYYQATNDPRLLECLADAVIGHSAQGTYDFLTQVSNLAEQIHEEATVDQVCAGIESRRRECDRVVDRRALFLLEFQVVLRAGRQAHGTEDHEARCLAALRSAAITGEHAEGELAHMAALLADPGRLEPESLAVEQLRQLKDLARRAVDADERLTIAQHLAEVEWLSDRREDAVQTLAAALEIRREESAGTLIQTLPVSANGSLQRLSGWHCDLGSFAAAEQLWRRELASQGLEFDKGFVSEQGRASEQGLWLREQLFSVYKDATLRGGALSIGEGPALYAAAVREMKAELATRSHEGHASQVVYTLIDLWRQAEGRFPQVAADLSTFAFSELPPILSLYQYRQGQSWISQLADRLTVSCGARVGLEFLIVRAENEPGWLRLRNESFWSVHGGALASAVSVVKDLGALDGRALAIFERELREDLRARQSRNRTGYDHQYGNFWSAKRAEFVRITKSFLEDPGALAAGRRTGVSVAYAADYLHRGLGASEEAVAALYKARRRGDLHLEGDVLLCRILHEIGRYEESIPVLRELTERAPETVNHWVMRMLAEWKTEDLAARDATFARAEAWFREHDLFHETTISALASGCLNAEMFEECNRLYVDAIALHVRSGADRGVGDGVLAVYYRHRSNALIQLGRTRDAVDAAAGAIVSWGRSHSERAEELQNLVRVLGQAKDVDAYLSHLDEEVRATGMESPIVRKALGQVFMQRKQFEAAATQFRLAYLAAPDDEALSDLLIGALDRLGRADLAVDVLLERTRRSGHEVRDFVSLGRRYQDLDQPERAERAFTMLAEQWAHESEGRHALAEELGRAGRHEDAVEQWRQVARIRSKEPTGYLGLADALFKVGRMDEAKEVAEFVRQQTWPSHFTGAHDAADRILGSTKERR